MLQKALLILLGISISKAIRLISHSRNGNQPIGVDASSEDNVILTQTDSPPATKYDVFLSFRGEDTRHNFASHLYKGLRDAGIHTFMDYKLHKGESISPVLLRTIEESEISVIIFSENYASSTWCLDELVHILECKRKFGRVVIPIFYNVDPSNIRKQNGRFGKRFNVLKQRFKDNQQKLQKWRNALFQSTSLSGWDSHTTSPEFKLIEEIVKDILRKLNYASSSHLEGLIGIARHIKNIQRLLTEAHTVGIWGMGGAGKTTLAKALFHELKAQFDAFSFIENVKEKLARIGLDELQKNCLQELLKDKVDDIKSTFVKNRLQRKKILLILDDVDNSIVAGDLTKVLDWFGDGSRIIITSRDMRVLKNASAFSRYHVPDLDFDDAFHLFSLKAFKQNEPSKGYMELSKSVVNYCQGNPLALVVLGCLLYDRGKEDWESALEKLNQTPPKDIVDVLRLSFDGLDDKQQKVFLDLAFLIKERICDISLNLVTQLYGSSAQIEISVLREKSLISFDSHDFIAMHDLVRKMGLEISSQQLFFGRKAPVRLWTHEDIYHFFHNDEGIEAIRCMSLDESKIDSITLTANHFRKMRYLMYLKVYKSHVRKPSNLTVCEDLDYLSKELRFLIWPEYPWSQLPSRFCAENLIKLDMPESSIRRLGDAEQQFPNLKEIRLRNSKHLSALPALSQAPNIERIFLDGCVNLDQIHSSTVMKKHVHLFIEDCGPMQINVRGSMKGTSSLRLVIVYNYLDVADLSLNKVTMKIFECGDIMCGVRFKHVRVPLGEMVEMRTGIQSLASLLPFVWRVDWLEGPMEFGDAFKQHYHTYYVDHYHDDDSGTRYFNLEVTDWGDRGEKGVVGKLMEDEEEEDDDDSNGDQVETTTLLMEDEEEEEEDDDSNGDQGETTTLLLMEEDDDDSESDTLLLTTTLLPNSIPRWSLLRRLTLKESDINMIGENAGQVSIIFKSLKETLSCTRKIKPLLAAQLSSPTLSLLPSSLTALLPSHHSLRVSYHSNTAPHVCTLSPSGLGFQYWEEPYDYSVGVASSIFQ